MGWIKERILAEHRKYSKERSLDWARLAEIKIEKAFYEELDKLKDLFKKGEITDGFSLSLIKPIIEKRIREEYIQYLRKIELDLFCKVYAHLVPKEQRDKTTKQVRELRDKEWNKALKKAKGDISKAHDILWDNIKEKQEVE